MIKKTIISFTTIFIIQFVFSCRCNCPEPKAYRFDFDNLIYKNKIEKFPKINEIAFTVILNDSSKLVVSNQSKGAFLNAAMACSCNNFRYGILKSPIKTIKIFTKYDFDPKFEAGSDISELFVGNENYSQFSGELYFNLSQFVQKLNDLNYSTSWISSLNILDKHVSFYLKTKPGHDKSAFFVQFEFENGVIFKTETEEFL